MVDMAKCRYYSICAKSESNEVDAVLVSHGPSRHRKHYMTTVVSWLKVRNYPRTRPSQTHYAQTKSDWDEQVTLQILMKIISSVPSCTIDTQT